LAVISRDAVQHRILRFWPDEVWPIEPASERAASPWLISQSGNYSTILFASGCSATDARASAATARANAILSRLLATGCFAQAT
jgi:hypothetical protein